MFGPLRPAVSLAVSSAVPAGGSWEAGGRTRGPVTDSETPSGRGRDLGGAERPAHPCFYPSDDWFLASEVNFSVTGRAGGRVRGKPRLLRLAPRILGGTASPKTLLRDSRYSSEGKENDFKYAIPIKSWYQK